MAEAVAVVGASLIRERLAAEYANGLADGVEITLRLLLGEESRGGIPYDGPPLPDRARFWARRALERVQAERAETESRRG